MKHKIIIGIRTNKFDSQSRFIYKHYESQGMKVVFIFDELLGPVNTGTYSKLSINPEFLSSSGLQANIDKIGWLCGDYGLYLMMQSFPDCDGYWLVEDDAFIKLNNVREFLHKPLDLEVDFSIGHLGKAHKHWKFINACKDYFGITETSIGLFSIVYISKRCCETALINRKKFVAQFNSLQNEKIFLNDESFLVNSPFMRKFNVINLFDLQKDLNHKSYNFTSISKITKINKIMGNIEDGLYHPVVIRTLNPFDYFKRLKKISKKKSRFKEELKDEINHLKKCLKLRSPLG